MPDWLFYTIAALFGGWFLRLFSKRNNSPKDTIDAIKKATDKTTAATISAATVEHETAIKANKADGDKIDQSDASRLADMINDEFGGTQ